MEEKETVGIAAAVLTDDLLATRRRNAGKHSGESGGKYVLKPRDSPQPPEVDRLSLMEC